MPHRPMIVLPLLLAVACSAPAPLTGTPSDYWSETQLKYEDRTYSPTVHTVQLFKQGYEMAPPMFALGSEEGVVLRFDDLAEDPEYLSYTVIHCTAKWEPSDMPAGMYLSGAVTDYLPTARQSFNTLQPYLQYELELPNPMMQFSVSGNYLLKVYRGSDQEDLVLTRRFMVYEQKVDITASIKSARQVDLRDVGQQVDLTVRHPNLPVQDAFGEIHVNVLQNMRWDDLRTDFTPRFMRGPELVYDYPEKGLFLGGNEFRNFEMKDLRFASQHVDRIVSGVGEQVYDVHLIAAPKRNIRVYEDLPDINGKFFIRNDYFDGDPLGADYARVFFTLPMPAPLGQEVYVFGAFTNWLCLPENRMNWNEERKAYTAELLLKQGFYDYAYVTKASGGIADITAIDGSHYQTENDYLIMVYWYDRTQRFDRLVGVRFLNSRRG